jgi:MFS family permease
MTTPTVSPLRAWSTMAVLSLAYVFSFVDRQALTLLIDPIRHDLKITDTQVSVLTGAAFAVLYATSAIPIARIADRGSRKRVLIAGVAVWGAMTAFCGLATNFWQLFIGRMGVGLGEAALTPSGFAMTAELFPVEKQARAMSVFVVGGSIGAGLSLLIGAAAIGALERWGAAIPLIGRLSVWQAVFVLLGLATLLLIPLLLTIVERRRSAPAADAPKTRRAFGVVWKNRRAFAAHFIGLPLMSLSAYGMGAWLPSHFVRAFGWAPSKVGVSLGGLLVVTGLAGAVWSSIAADRTRRAGRADASLWLLIVSTLASLPFLVLGMSLSNAGASFACLSIFFLINAGMNTLGPAALQAIAPDGMRAEISALFLLVANLVGIGLGPTAVAACSDYLLGGSQHIGLAVILVCGGASLAGSLIAWAALRDYRKAAEDPALLSL